MPLDEQDRFPAAGEFVGLVTEVLEDLPETAPDQPLYLERIALDLPFEIAVDDEGGALRVGMSPPTQTFETGVMPVWHRLRLTIAAGPAGEDDG